MVSVGEGLKLLYNSHDSPWMRQALPLLLKHWSFDEGMAISEAPPEGCGNFPWEYISYYHAKHAEYPVRAKSLLPLDQGLLQSFAEVETVALRMLDRIDNRWDGAPSQPLSYEERKRLYLKHVQYWNSVILQENVGAFFSTYVPHLVYDYIIYALCRHYGLPTVVMRYTQVPHVAVVGQTIAEPIYDFVSRPSPGQAAPQISRRLMRDHYRWMRKQKNPMPTYKLVSIQRMETWKEELKTVRQQLRGGRRRRQWLSRVVSAQTRNRWQEGLARLEDRHYVLSRKSERDERYTALAQTPDLTKKFIYVPLHLQPECSTCPVGEVYVDQGLMIDLLASGVPSDVLIYVKENLTQDHRSRSPHFYQDLLQRPNVRLVPMDFNSFDLIKHSLAVATITGTAGWEALFLGKPVLMFGSHFYQYAPGVFRIRTQKELASAFNAILQQGQRPNLFLVKNFLRTLAQQAVVLDLPEDFSSGSKDRAEALQHFVNRVAQTMKLEPAMEPDVVTVR